MLHRRFSVFAVGLCIVATLTRAEVTRVDIRTRADVGSSGYEKLVGKVYFAVDPSHRRNTVIADLELAPVNSAGRVEFTSDFYILRPKDAAKGNGAAIVEVSNRGGKGLLSNFNRGGKTDPVAEADLGDGFLMKQGFTLVWVGWEFDVPPTPGLLRIEVPIATQRGRTITGEVRAQFVIDAPTKTMLVTDLAAYPPADQAASAEAKLFAWPAAGPSRAHARATLVPRDRWTLSGHRLEIDGGFEPGWRYELVYTAGNPPIAGLGFAAIRDVSVWLKRENSVLPPLRHTYAFGISQSGRFLRDFLYHGFNTDENERAVYDGVISHIAGAARIDLNRRWATPRSLGRYPVSGYPFADTAQKDGETDLKEGLLENARVAHVPKIFYTNTSVEYIGGGRVAALVHADPLRERDLPLPESVRFYSFAGTQHGPARFPPPEPTIAQQRANPANYWWLMRALLPAMHEWVTAGTLPPASAYPTLRDQTLVPPARLRTPDLPAFAAIRQLTVMGSRATNPLLSNSGNAMGPLPLWIAQVDADGNELGGIRLPEVAVPLASYTGWNYRAPKAGAPEDLVLLAGSWIPFARTKAERVASNDPRPAIGERYPSRDEYLSRIEKAARALVQRRLMLTEDIPDVVREASTRWDWLMAKGAAASVK